MSASVPGVARTHGAIHATIAFLWYGSVVLAMDQVGAVLRRPAVSRVIKGAVGVLLVGFGIRLGSCARPRRPDRTAQPGFSPVNRPPPRTLPFTNSTKRT